MSKKKVGVWLMATKAKLRVPFHIPGKYIMEKVRDDDGSEVDFPRWMPGTNHAAGECFDVIRTGRADGVYGIADGMPVAICYRELRPAAEDLIGESEVLIIPLCLLDIPAARSQA